jgi:hypothetical protein
MITENSEIISLKNQLEAVNVQLEVLSLKHKTATEVAFQFAQELQVLRIQHQSLTQKLHNLEMHENGAYMWENIGDGG